MYIRVFESGSKESLHEFESKIVPQVGDVLVLEFDEARRLYCKVVNRMLRVNMAAEPGANAVYYLNLEVSEPDDKTWLTRTLD